MKFYYFQDPNGLDSHLFSTKKAALDWIRHADKTWLEEGSDTFQEHDMQVFNISTATKREMLKAMRHVSIISGSVVHVPELNHD